jgi:hypothetical protein
LLHFLRFCTLFAPIGHSREISLAQQVLQDLGAHAVEEPAQLRQRAGAVRQQQHAPLAHCQRLHAGMEFEPGLIRGLQQHG